MEFLRKFLHQERDEAGRSCIFLDKKKTQVIDLLGSFVLPWASAEANLVEPGGIEPPSASHHQVDLRA